MIGSGLQPIPSCQLWIRFKQYCSYLRPVVLIWWCSGALWWYPCWRFPGQSQNALQSRSAHGSVPAYPFSQGWTVASFTEPLRSLSSFWKCFSRSLFCLGRNMAKPENSNKQQVPRIGTLLSSICFHFLWTISDHKHWVSYSAILIHVWSARSLPRYTFLISLVYYILAHIYIYIFIYIYIHIYI